MVISADDKQLDISTEDDKQLDISAGDKQLDISADDKQLDISADDKQLDIAAGDKFHHCRKFIVLTQNINFAFDLYLKTT